MSIWIPPELQESPLRTVADHYVARGWTVCDVTACDVALKNLSVESMLDLPVEQRVHCGRQLPSDKWIVKVELDKGGLRPNNRTAEFAYSSVPAPWLDHPVEIAIPVTEHRPDRPLARANHTK
ncbi:MAG: hypothetical protein IPM54_24280 [Polyangiaceae bacterium]|nr:hypothetical protein [Polyangiaceae bacterium]